MAMPQRTCQQMQSQLQRWQNSRTQARLIRESQLSGMWTCAICVASPLSNWASWWVRCRHACGPR